MSIGGVNIPIPSHAGKGAVVADFVATDNVEKNKQRFNKLFDLVRNGEANCVVLPRPNQDPIIAMRGKRLLLDALRDYVSPTGLKIGKLVFQKNGENKAVFCDLESLVSRKDLFT